MLGRITAWASNWSVELALGLFCVLEIVIAVVLLRAV